VIEEPKLGALVDMSSISPIVTQRIFELKKNAVMLDAGHGERGAIQANFLIMAGRQRFNEVKPVLRRWARRGARRRWGGRLTCLEPDHCCCRAAVSEALCWPKRALICYLFTKPSKAAWQAGARDMKA
jgi:hypothetical protein